MALQKKHMINVVILGKVGTGKSSTGNTLCGRTVFDENNHLNSETKSFSKYAGLCIENYRCLIYDTKGLNDTEYHNKSQDELKDTTAFMYNLLQVCREITVFLFVFNVTEKFTKESQSTVDMIEKIFGKTFWNHCIVVFSRGDSFEENNFDEWLEEQEETLISNILTSCNRRIILAYNKEKYNKEMHRKSRLALIKAIINLKESTNTSYTKEKFDEWQKDRDILMLKKEPKETDLGQKFDEQIDDIRDTVKSVRTHADREEILQKIAVLNSVIIQKDNGTGELEEFIRKLDYVKSTVPKIKECTIS